jgi:hypothetical protein
MSLTTQPKVKSQTTPNLKHIKGKTMYIATRRAAMLGGSSLLFGCSFFTPTSTTIGGTPVSMAQAYADDLADALSSGADIYLASTTPTVSQKAAVTQAKADIQAAKVRLDAALASVVTTVPQTALDTVKLIIVDARKLAPIVSPFLGPAAMYIDLALGVLQTFADSLPPPPVAPAVPPAALREKAAAYRRGNK